MYDQGGLAVAAEGGDAGGEAVQGVLGREVAGLHGEHGDLGLKPVERAVRIKHLLSPGVELAHVDIDRDSGSVRSRLKNRHQRAPP